MNDPGEKKPGCEEQRGKAGAHKSRLLYMLSYRENWVEDGLRLTCSYDKRQSHLKINSCRK
ncbi:MAG: hypothetical protein CMM45_12295 [Rhodospirillaceae bacterium]|nr:hypothetical protein [Rhodospirillaceae bacterium]